MGTKYSCSKWDLEVKSHLVVTKYSASRCTRLRTLRRWTRVSDCAESISSGYHTAPLGIILRRVNLPRLSYCGESISRGYHTAGSHSWPWGVHSQFLTFLHRPLKNPSTPAELFYLRFSWNLDMLLTIGKEQF